jgi:5'-nucleotidase
MAVTLDDKLVVAISSRALFDFEEENQLFDPDHPPRLHAAAARPAGRASAPGVAFSLVKKLLAFNEPAQQRVEVVVLSRNDPVSGMRVFRSAKAHGLAVGAARRVHAGGGAVSLPAARWARTCFCRPTRPT